MAAALAGIGHNGGPQTGSGWQRHCWKVARENLLPTLPIEVLRNRVRRAAELGLEYKTYASVRAQTGHDVVAFLFSSNALRVDRRQPEMAGPLADRLARVEAGRIGLACLPLTPEALARANAVLTEAQAAPFALASWREAKQSLRAALGKIPGDRVILIGDHLLEADWTAAGGLAGYLPADRYFGEALGG